MKKMLALLLAAVMLFSVLPVFSAASAYCGVCGADLTWRFDTESKTLTISGTGEMYDYIASAPWYLQELTSDIEKIYIEDGVKSIGSWAFEGCWKVTEVELPQSLEKVGGSAFEGCASLQSISIPASTTKLVERAFSGCGGLKEFFVDPENPKYCNDEYGVLYTKDMKKLIQYPAAREGAYVVAEQAKLVCDFAFFECHSLTEIVLPQTLASIGVYGFYGCWSLRTVEIPQNVILVATAAFSGCRELRSVSVASEKTEFQDATFYECGNLDHLFYKGTKEQWYAAFPSHNDAELKATMHFEASGDELIKKEDGSLYCTICQGNFYSTSGFSDVVSTDYFHDAVAWALENHITNGVSETEFAPEEKCTRGQVVTFLYRARENRGPAYNPFVDVSKDAYYYEAVLWAVGSGITNGISATEFGPDMICTRAQVATFLWRSQGEPMPKSQENPFSDIDPTAYYYNAVLWAVEKGITNGVSATEFAPDAECTRGQIVTFLYRNELSKIVDYSLYIPVLQAAMEDTSQNRGQGFLFDFDENGVKELALTHYSESYCDAPVAYLVANLYTIENHKVLPLIENLPIYPEAGAPDGWAGVVKLNYQSYFAVTEENAESGSVDAKRDGSWKLFRINGSEAVEEVTVAYHYDNTDLAGSSAILNGESISYEEYVAWKESLSVVRTMNGFANELDFTLEELVEVVQQPEMKVALITDHGAMEDIGMLDLWYGIDEYCYANSIEYCYYWMSIPYALTQFAERAIEDGHNVILLMGYTAQGYELQQLQAKYPDVKFIVVNQKQGEFNDGYDFAPAQNSACISYKFEQAGFMAGYAAVKMGYRKLGLMMPDADSEAELYGNGFLLGADFAAVEDDIASEVEVNCTYAHQYYPSQEIYEKAAAWYQSGTEVIFTADPEIAPAVALAAAEFGGKVIGTMVDQAKELNFVSADKLFIESDFVQPEGGSDVTITSAMIGLNFSAQYTIRQMQLGLWGKFSGRFVSFDMGDGTRMLQLSDSTRFNESFASQDYENLSIALGCGTIVVDVSAAERPGLSITLHENA